MCPVKEHESVTPLWLFIVDTFLCYKRLCHVAAKVGNKHRGQQKITAPYSPPICYKQNNNPLPLRPDDTHTPTTTISDWVTGMQPKYIPRFYSLSNAPGNTAGWKFSHKFRYISTQQYITLSPTTGLLTINQLSNGYMGASDHPFSADLMLILHAAISACWFCSLCHRHIVLGCLLVALMLSSTLDAILVSALWFEDGGHHVRQLKHRVAFIVRQSQEMQCVCHRG